jgi:hypothetical protein
MLLYRVITISVVLLSVALPVYAFFPVIFYVGGIALAATYTLVVNEIRKEFALNRAAKTIMAGKNYDKQIAVRGGTLYLHWVNWMGDLKVQESDVMNAVNEAINKLSRNSPAHGFVNVVRNGDCPPVGGLGWEFVPGDQAQNGRNPGPQLLYRINNTDAVAPYVIVPKPKTKDTPLRSMTVNAVTLCKRDEVYIPMYNCRRSSTIINGQNYVPKFSLWHHPTSQTKVEMKLESDGNLCLYYHNPNYKNYWCANWRKPKGDFRWEVTDSGGLCRWDSTNEGVCTTGGNIKDGNYRLTIQSDGNLVMYRGKGLDKPVWSSGTNILPYRGELPCW